MSNQIPLKVKRDNTGNTNGLAEFESADTVGVNNGGTGADNAANARSNLGAASTVDLLSHTNDQNNPHQVTPAGIGAAEQAALDAASLILNQHVSDTNNPHNVTATQVGAIAQALLGAVNGVATLDASGKIPAVQIPAISLPQVYVVADEPTRLALPVQEGDEAIQTDTGEQFIFDGTTWIKRPSAVATFAQLMTETGSNINTVSPQAISFDNVISVVGDVAQQSQDLIRVFASGSYKICYSVSGKNCTNSRKNIRTALVVNGVEVKWTQSSGYCRNRRDELLTATNCVQLPLMAGDTVALVAERVGSPGDVLLDSAQFNIDRES